MMRSVRAEQRRHGVNMFLLQGVRACSCAAVTSSLLYLPMAASTAFRVALNFPGAVPNRDWLSLISSCSWVVWPCLDASQAVSAAS